MVPACFSSLLYCLARETRSATQHKAFRRGKLGGGWRVGSRETALRRVEESSGTAGVVGEGRKTRRGRSEGVLSAAETNVPGR